MAHTFLKKFAAAKVKLLMCHLSTWITEGSARQTMTVQNVRHVQTKLCGGRVSANGISPSCKSTSASEWKSQLNYFLYSITSLGLFGPHQNKYWNLLILQQLPFRGLKQSLMACVTHPTSLLIHLHKDNFNKMNLTNKLLGYVFCLFPKPAINVNPYGFKHEAEHFKL